SPPPRSLPSARLHQDTRSSFLHPVERRQQLHQVRLSRKPPLEPIEIVPSQSSSGSGKRRAPGPIIARRVDSTWDGADQANPDLDVFHAETVRGAHGYDRSVHA